MAISAFVTWNNGKAYAFRRHRYYRFDMAQERADPGYPKDIARGPSPDWPGLWPDGIDDGVLWNNGKAFFFKGDEYIRYDVASDRSDPGYPKKIAPNWPGLWARGIDAVVLWNNGKAFFFKGDEYIRYDMASDRSDPGYPKKIAPNWPGLWASGIDAAALWNNGRAYFFRRNEYIAYDVAADQAIAGYPKSITANWTDLEAVTFWIARDEWGADPGLPRLGLIVPATDRTEIFIHHTVVSDTDQTPNERETLTEVFAGMRSLQRSRPDLGLDVPYSVVGFVMRNGDLVLAEGRGLDRTGAHTPRHNSSALAVSFQGNFETTPGPADFSMVLEGLGFWLRWLRQTGGFANLATIIPPGARCLVTATSARQRVQGSICSTRSTRSIFSEWLWFFSHLCSHRARLQPLSQH